MAQERYQPQQINQLPAHDADIRPFVPDPLEGLVPGENRQERYKNFMNGTLAHIWPPSSESGQHTEYSGYLWGLSELAAGNPNGYIHFSPRAQDPRDLTPHQFERTVEFIGPDYLRVRAVDPQIAEEGFSGVNVGGSCIMETNKMRSANELRNAVAEGTVPMSDLTNLTLRAVEMAPTMTHVSGVQSPPIHYDESGMWVDRISNDYGVPRAQAEAIVRSAYARIDAAILQKARLAYNDPQREMVVVNFDELDLEGEKRRWFENLGLPYDPNLRIFDVISTYVGPEVKDQLNAALIAKLAKGELTPQQQAIAKEALQAEHHVRVKQVDHGSFESLPLPIGYIMRQEELTEEQVTKMQEDPIFRAAVVMLRDLFVRHIEHPEEQQGLYVGFTDTPAKGSTVAHKERWAGGNFTGNPGTDEYRASVEASLANPAYLHRGNVEEHLAYVARYTQDETAARNTIIDRKKAVDAALKPLNLQRKEVTVEINKLTADINNNAAKIAKHTETLRVLSSLLANGRQDVTAGDIRTFGDVRESAQNAIAAFDRREIEAAKPQEESKKPIKPLNDLDRSDRAELKTLVEFLTTIQEGQPLPILPEVLRDRVTAYANEAKNNIDMKNQQQLDAKQKLAQQQATLGAIDEDPEFNQLKQERVVLEAELDQFKQGPFPLHDNPLVHHAMNMLYDPDSAAFLARAVEIEQELNEKRAPIVKRADELRAILKDKERREIPAELRAQEEALKKEAAAEMKQLQAAEAPIRAAAKDKMRALSARYYPKVDAYIRYIFDEAGIVEFPAAMRNSRLVA